MLRIMKFCVPTDDGIPWLLTTKKDISKLAPIFAQLKGTRTESDIQKLASKEFEAESKVRAILDARRQQRSGKQAPKQAPAACCSRRSSQVRLGPAGGAGALGWVRERPSRVRRAAGGW